MSGIDIAGLILGSIPLIITGLEHYAEGVSTIKVMLNASSEFRTLSRRLRVEYDIFRNITELMLNGCVDDQELTELLENVGGRCWSNPAVELSLQKKLQRSYKVYVETVQEMDRTLKEFRKRLRLGDDGRGPFDDPRFFREAYRRFRFGLKRSAYMDLVEGISRDNAALDKLTNQCSALEPARRSRTRIPNFERIRGNACSVFDTLQKGVPGTCKESHVVSLYMNAVENESELESNELLDGSDELTFRIVLYHESIAPSAITLPWDFGEAEVRFLDSMTASSGSRDTAETQSKPTRVKRAIRFQDPDPAPCAQQDLATQYQQQQQQQAVEEIRDLCASIEQLRAVQCGVCLGYLRDVASPRRHGLFWPKKPLMDRGPLKKVSLRAVLAARDTQHGTKLSLGDGRRLALSLALGVLRLHDTPWLGRRWGCDDVTLIHQDGKLLAKYPIVSTHLGQAPMPKLACPAKQAYFAPSRNDSLFALGVVLIELCMREPFDQLSAPEDLTQDSTKHAASDFLTATRLLDEVYDRAGGRYGDAVRRCILCEFDQRKTSLEDDAFRRAVYDNVVTVLQEDVNQFYNL